MMKKDIVDIMAEKSFNELNQAELDEIREFCADEEEYDQMREVFLAMQTIRPEEIKPSQKVKADLDALFEKQHPKTGAVWYLNAMAAIAPRDKSFFQQPLVRVAAVLLIMLMVYPFINNSIEIKDKELVAEVQKERPEIKGQSGESTVVLEKNGEMSSDLASESQLQNPTLSDVEVMDELSLPVESLFDAAAERVAQPPMADQTLSRGLSHPDGVFAGTVVTSDDARLESTSISVGETPKLLDLLTATF